MSNIISLIGLLAGVILLMYLVYRGMNVVVMTILCSLFIAVTSGMDVLDTFTNVYMNRFGTMIGVLGAIFIFGAVIGAIYDASGAAYSLVRFFSTHIRTDNPKTKSLVSVLCVMVITVGLGYFGVDTLVLIFLTAPVCTAFCREFNWSAKFVPVLIMSGPLANILPGAAQNYNIIPTRYLGTHPMASALPGFIACAVGFVLILLYTTRAINKSIAAGEVFEETDQLRSQKAERDSYPPAWLAFLPLLSIFICFNVLSLTIEVALFTGAVLSVALLWKYMDSIPDALNKGIGNAARTVLNFGALMGFAKVAMSTPVFTSLVDAIASNQNSDPVLITVASVALLTGIGNSATSGITASMEAFLDYYLSRGVSPAVIHRAATLTGATLDTLPTNSGVIISMNMTGSTHKQCYKYIFVNTVLIPFIVVILYVLLIKLFPAIASWPI